MVTSLDVVTPQVQTTMAPWPRALVILQLLKGAGSSLAHGLSRQDQTLLVHFRSGHIKSMKFFDGRKSFELCTNCSSEPATPAHILESLGLTKQDLSDVPLLVLDFLKVYNVMDLV
ncbi:uncharacterized protein TNCV_245611 [Trichonephila clavipes]|nr:uncharacterized protein TNCV_245611 [Trichonephila clavipes]